MYLKEIEINGFKSFAKKTALSFDTPITAIVGPNGSGKSNVAEALRWVLGEQSMKSLRGKKGEDLIFNGSSGVQRLSRASVSITFDNSKKVFNIDFPEVVVKREVHRDGTNEYYINDSQVRLKDVYELLAQVSLGASSHHIISQGEADRILTANSKERKSMIEDALGLKIFQYKKAESQKKLEKTRENIKEALSLRRELAPQIRYLKKQVEQIEQIELMREELAGLYANYFSIEDKAVKNLLTKNSEEFGKLSGEQKDVDEQLAKSEEKIDESDKGDREEYTLIKKIESELRELAIKKDEDGRRLGRIEGMIEVIIPDSELSYVSVDEHGGKKCKYCGQGISEDHEHNASEESFEKKKIELENEKRILEDALTSATTKERELTLRRDELQAQVEESTKEVRQIERSLYDLKNTRNNLVNKIERLKEEKISLLEREERFKREQAEAGILLRGKVLFDEYKGDTESVEVKVSQEERKRRIERLKIKIEDSGATSTDVTREYKEKFAEDEHLATEIKDLEDSALSLEKLMEDLAKTLETRFQNGLSHINGAFDKYFSILFGGGEAKLLVQREVRRKTEVEEMLEGTEEKEEEFGISISVNLPRKKIRGLDMLSGGERALTSIALLFAMSQVNPPPFLVLDETDAALDEANSRKYGDMVESLSKHSQLIVITHNRETMSRANVLYGVTMGGDSISKLLSIKFDEAASYAK